MAWCISKYRSNLYLVLYGLLFGVLGMLVISFYVTYRAVGLAIVKHSDIQCISY